METKSEMTGPLWQKEKLQTNPLHHSVSSERIQLVFSERIQLKNLDETFFQIFQFSDWDHLSIRNFEKKVLLGKQ